VAVITLPRVATGTYGALGAVRAMERLALQRLARAFRAVSVWSNTRNPGQGCFWGVSVWYGSRPISASRIILSGDVRRSLGE